MAKMQTKAKVKTQPKAQPKAEVKAAPKAEKAAKEKLLAKVPEEKVFWCCDGRVMRDMMELADALAAMTEESYIYHVTEQKNDFCNWVRDVIGDVELAEELAEAHSRMQAADTVEERLLFLEG